MRNLQLGYGRVAGFALLIIVTVVGFAIFVLTSIRDHDVDTRREMLLSHPMPTPIWIWALGPTPSEIVSIENAVYGIGIEDQFWPGAGVICVQIDSAVVHIASPDQLLSNVTLELNGEPVRKAGVGQLMWGSRIVPGLILPSRAKQALGLNACWRMILDPGDYLAELQVTQSEAPSLVYSWAFRLTEK